MNELFFIEFKDSIKHKNDKQRRKKLFIWTDKNKNYTDFRSLKFYQRNVSHAVEVNNTTRNMSFKQTPLFEEYTDIRTIMRVNAGGNNLRKHS